MDPTELAVTFQEALRPEDVTWLKGRGLTETTIRRHTLGYVAEGRYRGSISIPYPNPDGSIRTIRFRYLNPGRRKYDNFKGQNIHIYNVAYTAKPKVWVTEGEFDSLVLTQMGFPAVGIPGASGFKSAWKYLFANCEQVSLVFDSDDAGEKGAARLKSLLGDVVTGELRHIRLPEGLDVTDTFLRDPSGLKELVT